MSKPSTKRPDKGDATPGVSREKGAGLAPVSDPSPRVRPWLGSLPLLSSPSKKEDESADKEPAAQGRRAPAGAALRGTTAPAPRPESSARILGAGPGQAPHALRAYRAPIAPVSGNAPARPATTAGRATTAATAGQGRPVQSEGEREVNPLRVISRDLVGRGMPAALVADLLAETVAEYGGQVLMSERDARLAFIDILLSRIPVTPLLPPPGRQQVPLTGTYLITGPAGCGKSVTMAHLALYAARAGQRDVVIVNTQGGRIGAAAQANALGAVFGYDVEHLYSPEELRELIGRRGARALLLVETGGWSPSYTSVRQANSKGLAAWLTRGATVISCAPATGQGDDIRAALDETRTSAPGALAALCKTSETCNVAPALGALAALRQTVGMVVPGPDLTDATPPPDLAAVVADALGGEDGVGNGTERSE